MSKDRKVEGVPTERISDLFSIQASQFPVKASPLQPSSALTFPRPSGSFTPVNV